MNSHLQYLGIWEPLAKAQYGGGRTFPVIFKVSSNKITDKWTHPFVWSYYVNKIVKNWLDWPGDLLLDGAVAVDPAPELDPLGRELGRLLDHRPHGSGQSSAHAKSWKVVEIIYPQCFGSGGGSSNKIIITKIKQEEITKTKSIFINIYFISKY